MPKIRQGGKPVEQPKRPACPDRLCGWPEGGECCADEANIGAVDAEQFVWTRIWDGCPRMALEREREEAWDHGRIPPIDADLPQPVLSIEGLRAAREAFAREVRLDPNLLGVDFDEVTKTLVAAYLQAVEFGT